MRPVTTVALLTRSHASVAVLRAAAPEDEFIEADPRTSLEAIARAEVALGGNDPDRVRVVLAAAPGLRWYASVAAGAERLVAEGLVGRPGLAITNNSGAYDITIAEHVLALVFAAAKRLPDYGRAQARGEWVGWLAHTELRGATLVIHGMGSIGGEVARLGAGLGMRVVGVRRRPGSVPAGVERVVGPEGLAGAVAEADFLVIAAPLTAATRGSVSAEVLARMKPSAWIVNNERGAIVDEDALVAALRGGRLGGAALDVFSVEPLPREHALWSLPNVIVTPHAASSSLHVAGRTMAAFLENLGRWKRGEPLRNLVDPEAGY